MGTFLTLLQVVEDADRALESHQQQPFELHGRQLRVEKARGQR